MFSAETNGADEIIKEWFFSLAPDALLPVIRKYGEAYGQKAEFYARDAYDNWSAGKLQMSGMVAQRLFSILPEFMPADLKRDVVWRLWQKHRTTSTTLVEVGRNVTADDVWHHMGLHLKGIQLNHDIPEKLADRFNWLWRGDVSAYQQVFNAIQIAEVRSALCSMRDAIDLFCREISRKDGAVREFTYQTQAAGHFIKLAYDYRWRGLKIDGQKHRDQFESSRTLTTKFFNWVGAVLRLQRNY